MDKETRRRLSMAVAVIGFIIIVLNAAEYLMGWDTVLLSSFVGLMLVIMGVYMSKNKK